MRVASLAVAMAMCVLACSSAKEIPSADTSMMPPPSTRSPAPSTSQQTIASADCRHDGKWALCSIERRLTQSGFVVKSVDDTTHRAGFTVKPAVYTLGKSRIEIFLYRDSAAAAEDIAKLDTLTVGPLGKPSQWGETPPTLIRSANIAAVLLSGSARQTERAINA